MANSHLRLSNKKEPKSSIFTAMVMLAGKNLHKIDNSSLKITTEINLKQIEIISNEVNRWYDLLEEKYRAKLLHEV